MTVVRFEKKLADGMDDPSEHSSVENRRTCQRSLITYHGCHPYLETSLSQEPQNATSYSVGRGTYVAPGHRLFNNPFILLN
jgi:hypothetical protein